MLKKITALSIGLLGCVTFVRSQDSASVKEEPVSPLIISGSVDTYYKYDLSGYKPGNIPTSFANENNSISLGMVDVAIKKATGKASFVGEVSFGPRGQYQSLPNGNGDGGNGDNSFQIQNLYVSYAFTDKFSMTAGYMGTFVGYEVISPTGNFNYSTSYLFTGGPFQNAGIKANYSFSDKVGVMLGLFNDWNQYRDVNGVSHFGGQLFLAPAEGWSAYFNFLTGKSADTGGTGTVLDLTTAYQITEKFKLGLNAADYTLTNDLGGYSGVALYPQYAFTKAFALGLRGEYFQSKDATIGGVAAEGQSVTALTVSANIKAGNLTVIPEIRFDNSSAENFFKENGNPTKSASQFLIGAVYSF